MGLRTQARSNANFVVKYCLQDIFTDVFLNVHNIQRVTIFGPLPHAMSKIFLSATSNNLTIEKNMVVKPIYANKNSTLVDMEVQAAINMELGL